ncbi:MAG: sigma-70 family RNA polymerase sigma factor [Blastocatellia bacterium]|nr:sigma-70 family RNA polymerase sigma factor [Blastocatellia bacterium]
MSLLLIEWGNGNKLAFDKLISILYEEIKDIASRYFQSERINHTLQATAVVNELYLRLVKTQVSLHHRQEFYALSSTIIRNILVDHARKFSRVGGKYKISLNEQLSIAKDKDVDLVALDDALNGLEQVDPLQKQLVELKYFGGFSVEELAEYLKISPRRVKVNGN